MRCNKRFAKLTIFVRPIVVRPSIKLKQITVMALICTATSLTPAFSANENYSNSNSNSNTNDEFDDILQDNQPFDESDLSYDEPTSNDDIDAVIDKDAFAEDIIVDSDSSQQTTGSDTGQDVDFYDGHLGEQTELELDVMQEPLDLTFEHVPLNAISPNTIQTFVEVIDRVRQDYVKPVNDELLFKYAIVGMLEKLDSHAQYLTPENYDKLRNFTDGEIGQVGLSARYDTQSRVWVIDSVVEQSSASDAGVQVGDKLLNIKKIELDEGMTPQDIDQLLSGVAGTQVEITIIKTGAKNTGRAKRNLVLQRTLSKNNALEVRLQEGIAVVRLPIFQNTTKNQLLSALRKLNVPISGVVLDVRNNPGGVLSAAIDVASLFIEDKGLIQVRNRTNSSQIISPNGVPYLKNLPTIVLQNRYSASAAEVLSSSLKSNYRARVVGEVSFGKGTVQEVIPLETGGAIKLTAAEYRHINGDPIDGIGVKPDVTFLHDGSDWQQQAITLLVSQDLPAEVQLGDIGDNTPIIDDY